MFGSVLNVKIFLLFLLQERASIDKGSSIQLLPKAIAIVTMLSLSPLKNNLHFILLKKVQSVGLLSGSVS